VLLVHLHAPFDAALRRRVLELAGALPAELALLHVELGRRCAQAARAALERTGQAPGAVAAVASAGLTAAHLPPGPDGVGATLSLGDGDVIAAGTGCTVVSDFRAADRAAGGHGAPLVPWADAVLLRPRARAAGAPVAALNLGGIGNLTVVPTEGDPIAFDTGPGNMLLDGALARRTAGRTRFDEGGALGCAGRVDAAWLAQLVAEDDFLRQPPPRSTGRERYGDGWLAQHAAQLDAHRPPDLAATLAAFTVEAVALAIERHVAQRPIELIVSGGGALNRCLMQGLATRLPTIAVSDSQATLGIPVLAKEAVAFALLGDATLRGVPSNVPSVTGARQLCVLGKLSSRPLGS
jgi:anhydro-N-acetylmuramic acid kinase